MDFGVAVTCGLPEKRVFNKGKGVAGMVITCPFVCDVIYQKRKILEQCGLLLIYQNERFSKGEVGSKRSK